MSKLTDIENREIDLSRATLSKLTDVENREIDLSRLVSTKASELSSSLNTISGKIDGVSNQINNAVSTTNDLASRYTQKVDELTSAINTNTQAISVTNRSVVALSRLIGTANDDYSANTLFAKTNLLVDRLGIVKETVNQIKTGVDSANETLARVETAVSINSIDDNTMNQMYSELGVSTDAMKNRIKDAINWLKTKGYAR